MTTDKEPLGTLPFVLGGVSFIPLHGVPFGVVAIIWGLATKRQGGRKLAIVGAAGIMFSVILYSGLFYFGFKQRGGVYDDLRAQLSRSNLGSLVQAIEFYRTQNGSYPASLEQLRASLPQPSFVFIEDPASFGVAADGRAHPYYYELVDDLHYYLLGVGPDTTPFTADDVLPAIEVRPQGAVGLLVKVR